MFDRRVTLTIADGIRIVVPDSLNLITPYVLVEQQDWFEDELRFVRAVLQPGSVAIDIGANYGVYTLSMAHVVGSTGAVYAFEPASRTASFLRESLEANRFTQVVLEQMALSSVPGSLPLTLNDNSELNSLTTAATENAAVEWVDVVTLDGCLERYSWSTVDFLKIDAEGEELKILKGAERFLSTLSPLIEFEIRAGTSFNLEMIEELKRYDFRFFRLVPGLNALVPFDPEATPDPFLLNLFAAKPDGVARLQALGRLVEQESPYDPSPSHLVQQWGQPRHHWSQALGQLPYGAALFADWERSRRGKDGDELDLALTLYAMSQDAQLSMTTRVQALELCLQCFEQLCAADPRKLHEASYARVALDYGARSSAVQKLVNRINLLQQEQQVDLTEPFLAPIPRYDQVEPRGQSPSWGAAALLEAIEIAGAYSSFYTAGDNRQRLEFLVSLGFAGPEMERRLQLVRARFPTPA